MKLYKTVITVEVLSVSYTDRPPYFQSLEAVHRAITHGSCSGDWDYTHEELTEEEFEVECERHHTDIEFFFPDGGV